MNKIEALIRYRSKTLNPWTTEKGIRDHLTALGMPWTATRDIYNKRELSDILETAQRLFWKKAEIYHPDHGGDARLFRDCLDHYNRVKILIERKARREERKLYDGCDCFKYAICRF